MTLQISGEWYQWLIVGFTLAVIIVGLDVRFRSGVSEQLGIWKRRARNYREHWEQTKTLQQNAQASTDEERQLRFELERLIEQHRERVTLVALGQMPEGFDDSADGFTQADNRMYEAFDEFLKKPKYHEPRGQQIPIPDELREAIGKHTHDVTGPGHAQSIEDWPQASAHVATPVEGPAVRVVPPEGDEAHVEHPEGWQQPPTPVTPTRRYEQGGAPE